MISPPPSNLAASPPAQVDGLNWSGLWPWLVVLIPWALLIRHLSNEWALNAQYGYGFFVPLLALYLGFQRWPTRPAPRPARSVWPLLTIAVALASLLAPLLLIAEVSQEWRVIGWWLAAIALGLSACLLLYRAGWPWLAHFAFPLLFMLVAVPWPWAFEFRVIGHMMAFDARCAVEIAQLCAYPAVQHENMIELPNGLVDVDEACSGVRSLQTSIMIALFAGELLQFPWLRRFLLLVGALLLTYALNLLRVLFLVYLSANLGNDRMHHWHDAAGLSVLALSLLGLWALANLLRTDPPRPVPTPANDATKGALRPWPRRVMIGFAAWFMVAVAATQIWYGLHEIDAQPPVRWGVQWPREMPGYQAVTIPENIRGSLMFSPEGSSGATWRAPNSLMHWTAYFLRWPPGRDTSILASNHHPDICLPANGRPLKTDYGFTVYPVAGLKIPFRIYEFDDDGAPLFVFFCVWADRHPGALQQAEDQRPDHQPPPSGLFQIVQRQLLPYTPADALAYRFQMVAAGERNSGQQLLELGLWGSKNLDEAKKEFSSQLTPLIIRTP